MKIFLTGFMGAGKTEVGSQLAELMGIEFVDLDAIVEQRRNESIAEILATRGEEEFRRLEHQALRSLATSEDSGVVATGGGTPTRPLNLELMRSAGVTVWLDTPLETILDRLDDTARRERPLFESADRARELYAQRQAAYSTADVHLRLHGDEEPVEVARRVLGLLAERRGEDGMPARPEGAA